MVLIKTKTQAAAIFGNYARLGKALGVTRGAINQWPEKLNTRQQNEVMGAAIRAGLMPCQ
jgi:hypothetical protein